MWLMWIKKCGISMYIWSVLMSLAGCQGAVHEPVPSAGYSERLDSARRIVEWGSSLDTLTYRFFYDGAGLMVRDSFSSKENAGGHRYGYDAQGLLAHVLQYETQRRLRAEFHAESGNWRGYLAFGLSSNRDSTMYDLCCDSHGIPVRQIRERHVCRALYLKDTASYSYGADGRLDSMQVITWNRNWRSQLSKKTYRMAYQPDSGWTVSEGNGNPYLGSLSNVSAITNRKWFVEAYALPNRVYLASHNYNVSFPLCLMQNTDGPFSRMLEVNPLWLHPQSGPRYELRTLAFPGRKTYILHGDGWDQYFFFTSDHSI